MSGFRIEVALISGEDGVFMSHLLSIYGLLSLAALDVSLVAAIFALFYWLYVLPIRAALRPPDSHDPPDDFDEPSDWAPCGIPPHGPRPLDLLAHVTPDHRVS